MVKKIMIIGIVVLLLLGVFGCSAQDTKITGSSEKSGESIKKVDKAVIPQLTLEEAFAKIDKKENFIFIVTQSTCSYCNSFKKTLVPFLREHLDIPFYEIEVDMIGEMKADINMNFEKLQKKVPEFSGGTPEMFCYENGKLKKSISGEISEIALTNYMIDCGYIKGEKQEEETVDYTFETSKKIKFENVVDVAKKINEKDTFYLMINEADRYNQAFIKKLIPVLEDQDITVTGLSFPLERKGSDEEMNKAYETVINSIKDLSISPAVFEIKGGKATKLMEDNITEKEIKEAFTKK